MPRFSEILKGVVAIESKELRRSFDCACGQSALHMIGVWGCAQRMVLAGIATDAQSNEITAAWKLLEVLSLSGNLGMEDALNRQRSVAQQILDQRGDDALALKANQPNLHAHMPTCRPSWMIRLRPSAPQNRRLKAISAGSRSAVRRPQAISAGCGRRTTGPAWLRSPC